MHIDIILDSRLDAKKIAKLGSLAESYGIQTVWNSSLLDGHDPFTNLSLLADTSSNIRLGPIAVNPFDMHPVRIASSLLSLNELCDGRANIVIGGGGEALEALSIKPERRVRAVRECVEILKGVTQQKPLNYQGELYQVKRFNPFWATSTPPAIYVGANMPQMLAMAAKVADGIFMSDLPPALVQQSIKIANSALAATDQANKPLRFNNFYAWHVYDDREVAVSEARQWLALRAIFRRWVNESFLSSVDCDIVEANFNAFLDAARNKTPIIKGVPEPLIDQLVQNMTLTGHVNELDRIIDRLIEFKRAGLTDIALRLYQQPEASIKLIGERVIPALE
jgi:alkanesulfonate monooxygenase SsuD/methylene tetrahydromethanopterin reductase-like flavin-dependent oxidoreductase (luciferase family)